MEEEGALPCLDMFQFPVSQCFTTFRTWWISFFNSGRPLYLDLGSPHIALASIKYTTWSAQSLPTVPASPVSSYDLGICPTLGQLEGWWHHVTIASDEANLERDALWDCSCIRSKETFCFKAWQMVCPWLSVQRLPTDYMGKHCQIPIIVDIDMIRYVQNLGKSLLQTAKL